MISYGISGFLSRRDGKPLSGRAAAKACAGAPMQHTAKADARDSLEQMFADAEVKLSFRF